MRILVDIDGTLCIDSVHENFITAYPLKDTIDKIKLLQREGHEVVFYTARYKEDETVTKNWLSANGLHGEIIFDKPKADLYIDDKSIDFVPNLGNDKLHRKRLAICYSGGLDSFIAYNYAIKEMHIAQEDILALNFNIGQPYYEKELDAITNLGVPYTQFTLDLIRSNLDNNPTVENYIIPGRNMIFVSIAASFADEVWIVGTKHENHPLMYDKNNAFYRLATLALSQSLGKTTVVTSPFFNFSKTEIIQWAITNGLTKEQLSKTVSCYHPTLYRCGECGLCFKRYIAMMTCGIVEDFVVNPRLSATASEILNAYNKAIELNDFSHYSKERILETLDVMNKIA